MFDKCDGLFADDLDLKIVHLGVITKISSEGVIVQELCCIDIILPGLFVDQVGLLESKSCCWKLSMTKRDHESAYELLKHFWCTVLYFCLLIQILCDLWDSPDFLRDRL